MIRSFRKIRELDTFILIIGIITGIIISSMYLLSSTMYLLSCGIALSLAFIIYFIINKTPAFSLEFYKTKKIKIIYNILFFNLLSVSFWILHFSEIRPIIYFVVISLCSMILSVSILSGDSKKDTLFQILQIFVISLNLIYSIYYFYSYLPLSDSSRHLIMNNQLAIDGNLNALWDKETYFPLMHLQVAVTKLLLNCNIVDASNTAVIVPFVISSICIYLVVRTFFDEKIALFSLLILNITDYNILWGSQPQTTTYGISIYFFIMFVIAKLFLFDRNELSNYQNKNTYIWKIILLLLIISMFFAHAVSSFILLVTLLGLSLGTEIYNKVYGKKTSLYLFSVTILAAIELLQYWMIALYSKGGASFFNRTVWYLNLSVNNYAGFLNIPETVLEYAVTLPPFSERFVDLMGFSILLLFSIIGALFWISPKYRNKFTISIATCIILLFSISFGFPTFGLRNIIPDRWFIFEYFFLSMMTSFALMEMLKRIHNPKKIQLFIMSFFFLFCFLMISNTTSNTDSPLWLKNSTPSEEFTNIEMQGFDTLSKYSPRMLSDYQFGRTTLEIKSGFKNATIRNKDQIYSENDTIFIWRRYTLNRPVSVLRVLKGTYDIKYVKLTTSQEIFGNGFYDKLNMYDKVYDNQKIIGFYIIN